MNTEQTPTIGCMFDPETIERTDRESQEWLRRRMAELPDSEHWRWIPGAKRPHREGR